VSARIFGVPVRETDSPSGDGDIEVVKLAFDAFARRDVDAALEWMHPQVRLWVVTAAVSRAGRPYIGHQGVREYWRDAQRLWRELELVPIDFELVGQAVVVLGEVQARGPAGALRQPAVWTWKLNDGLVVDCRVDSDVRAARDALGEAQSVADVLRGFHDGFNRRDAEAMIALADPGVVSYPAILSRARGRYVGHKGLRNWVRDVSDADHGHTVAASEVRRVEEERWAVLGQVMIDEAPISPFTAFVRVHRGLVGEVREFLSDEAILSQVAYLP
jgi:ketosteroid isomerase-like protein